MIKRSSRDLLRPAWSVDPQVVRFDSRVDDSLLSDLVNEIESTMKAGETYKRCRARWVSRIDLPSGPVVVKLFTERSARHALKQRFQRSRARRAAEKAFRYTEYGFNTPQPLAILQEQRGPFRGNSCIIYEYIDGANIAAGSWRMLSGVAELQGKSGLEYIYGQIRETRDRLIQAGLAHCDCHAGNFMFDRQGRLYLLDLDSIKPARVRRRNGPRMHYLFDLLERGITTRANADAA
ncbi:lipopolysaccharide kinase InaA family protein [Stieleria marina]